MDDDREYDFDEWWEQHERDRQYKLTGVQCRQKTASYRRTTAAVILWLRHSARHYNWEKFRVLEDHEAAASNGSLPSQDDPSAVAHYRDAAEYLETMDVALPRQVQDCMEHCIKLRRQVNLHYVNNRPELKEDNESHEWFISIWEYILEILRDRRESFAIHLHKLLQQMQDTTRAVMDAWKQHKSTGRGLMQAILITYAAIERAMGLETNFQEKMNSRPKWKELLEILYRDRGYSLLHVEGLELPNDLSTDIRVLLGIEKPRPMQKSCPNLRRNLDLLHFPSTYVMDNYQAISNLWKSQGLTGPIPGYPVDLSLVYNEEEFETHAERHGGHGRNRKEETMAKYKLLRDHYNDQIITTWKLLNEIKLLFTYKLDYNTESGTYNYAPLPQDEKPFSPAQDSFSKTLEMVVYGDEILQISTSFTIQLLARLSQLFRHVTSADDRLLWGQTFHEVIFTDVQRLQKRQEMDRGGEDLFLDEIYEELQGAGHQHKLKTIMSINKADFPAFYSDYGFQITSSNRQEFLIRYNGVVQSVVQINRNSRYLHTINLAHGGGVDVNWYISPDSTMSYATKQPLFLPWMGLKRRIKDHAADAEFANRNFSVFTLVHLIQALKIMEPDLEDARQDKIIFRQQADWFDVDYLPTSAEDLLDLIITNVSWDGEKWEYSEGTQCPPWYPIETLYRLFVQDQWFNGHQTMAKFARQLDRHIDQLQCWEDVHFNKETGKEQELWDKMKRTEAAYAEKGPDTELSWERVVDVLTEHSPKLPCCDIEIDLYEVVNQYTEYLRTIGQAIGCMREADEEIKSYHSRLLHIILQDFYTKERASQEAKAQGSNYKKWRSKTYLSQVKSILQLKNARDQEREEEREAKLRELG